MVAEALDPAVVVRMLAEPARLRVFACVALGSRRADDIAAVAGVTMASVHKALERLIGEGLIELSDAGYRVAEERLNASARAQAGDRTAPVPGTDGWSDEQIQVLRSFVVDGRLQSVPVARAKRQVVLDWLAGRFEPGVTYPEPEVNMTLGTVYPDYAALRRYLVDDGFLERRDGFYWRSGGTVEDSPRR